MSTTTTPPTYPVSPEEYLARERVAETKSEYFAGEIVAMSGASRAHNLIVGNVVAALHGQLRGRPCELYPNDMRVGIAPRSAYLYPDAIVVCGKPEFAEERRDTLLNPTLVVEVLSPSTERYDRGKKWEHYRRIDSLREYLLISQDSRRVEHYVRQEGGLWLFAEAGGEEGVLELPAVGGSLALADVFERVFDDVEPEPGA